MKWRIENRAGNGSAIDGLSEMYYIEKRTDAAIDRNGHGEMNIFRK